MTICKDVFFPEAVEPLRLNTLYKMISNCKKLHIIKSKYMTWVNDVEIYYSFVLGDHVNLHITDGTNTDLYFITESKLEYINSFTPDPVKKFEQPVVGVYKNVNNKVVLTFEPVNKQENLVISDYELADIFEIHDPNNKDVFSKISTSITNLNNSYLKIVCEMDNSTIKNYINKVLTADSIKRIEEIKRFKSDLK